MKQKLLLLLMVLVSLPGMAQHLTFGFVKDEGGVTNVRKGPGTSYAVVEKIDDGMFIAYGANTNGWCKAYHFYQGVLPNESTFMGYIAASKVVAAPRSCPFLHVGVIGFTQTGQAYLRKSASAKAATLGTIKNGTVVLCGEEVDGFVPVYSQTGKLLGYVKVQFIDAEEYPTREYFFPEERTDSFYEEVGAVG